MNVSRGVADLHMHTTASDGTSTVPERTEQASERDLESIAITDHDVIPDELDDRVSRAKGVELISGVEVRADIDGTKVEILGYYVDPTNETLESLLKRVRGYRTERNREMISKVREVTNLEVDYEEVRDEADGLVGRPHIAELLVESGVVEDIGSAFKEYLGNKGSAFVPIGRVPAREVIDAIHEAGGVASLAHPGRIRTDDVEGILQHLAETGIDGVEVAYPYDDAPDEGYADVDVADADEFAELFGLLRTGGSDCHGPESGKFRIGEVLVSSEWLESIRSRANERSEL